MSAAMEAYRRRRVLAALRDARRLLYRAIRLCDRDQSDEIERRLREARAEVRALLRELGA